MGLMAVYPKPRLSLNPLEHKRFPYLLKGLAIVRPNQVWSIDITYIRLRGGFVYLAAVIDWYSRYVLAWELSISLEADFCVAVLERAWPPATGDFQHRSRGAIHQRALPGAAVGGPGAAEHGRTRAGLRQHLRGAVVADCQIRGSLSQGLPGRTGGAPGLGNYFPFYNDQRIHQALDYRTPKDVHFSPPDEAGCQRNFDRRGARAKARSSPPCSFNLLIMPGFDEQFHHLKSPKKLSRQWGAPRTPKAKGSELRLWK